MRAKFTVLAALIENSTWGDTRDRLLLESLRNDVTASTSIEYAIIGSGLSLVGVSFFERFHAAMFAATAELSAAMGSGFTLLVIPN